MRVGEVLQHRHRQQQLKRLLHLSSSSSSLTCLHTLFYRHKLPLGCPPLSEECEGGGGAGEKSCSICRLKLSSISIFISYFLSRLSLRSFISFQCSLRTFPSFTLLMNPFVRNSFTCCALFPPSVSLSLSSVFLLHPFLLRSWCGCIASFRFILFGFFLLFFEVLSYLCTGYITFNEFFYCFVNRVEVVKVDCAGKGEQFNLFNCRQRKQERERERK